MDCKEADSKYILYICHGKSKATYGQLLGKYNEGDFLLLC